MTPLIINAALAFGWVSFSGSTTALNWMVGFVLGYIVLVVHQRVVGKSTYYYKVWDTLYFTLRFVYALVASSVTVAAFVLDPRRVPQPAIISFAMETKTDFEIVILGNIISLTPGTLTLDVSPDRSVLYIHCMDAPNPDAVCRDIRTQLERPLLELMR